MSFIPSTITHLFIACTSSMSSPHLNTGTANGRTCSIQKKPNHFIHFLCNTSDLIMIFLLFDLLFGQESWVKAMWLSWMKKSKKNCIRKLKKSWMIISSLLMIMRPLSIVMILTYFGAKRNKIASFFFTYETIKNIGYIFWMNFSYVCRVLTFWHSLSMMVNGLIFESE